MRKVLSSLLLLIPALSFAGETTTQVVPNKPIVITSDARDTNGYTVKAPWFSFHTNINNATTLPLTITEVSLTITNNDPTGGVLTKVVTFTPAAFDTVITSGGNTIKCQFTSFGEFAGGASGSLVLSGATSPECANGRVPVFYVGENNHNPTFDYQVKMVAKGWYGTYDNPIKRFEQVLNFETQ